MPGAVAALAGGSIVGGLMQGRAAGQAADAQVEAAEAAAAEQRRQYDLSREDLAPYREAGYNALSAMQYMTGIGAQPTFGGTAPEIVEIGGGSGGSGGSGGGTRRAGPAAGLFGVEPGTLIPDAGGSPYVMATRREDGGEMYAVQHRDSGRIIGDWTNGRGPVQQQIAQMGMEGHGGGGSSGRFKVGDQVFDTRKEAEAYANANKTGGTPFEWKTTPGYEFRLDEGQKAMERMASARGMRLGGATMKEALRYGEGMAANEFGNVYNRLAGQAGTGQTAVNSGNALGAQAAGNIGNALMQGGQARASGYTGQANALTGTLNNLGGLAGAAYGGQFGPSPGFGITPSPAGLSAWGY